MAPPAKSRLDRDARREAILDVAQDVFLEEGFAAGSMSTIAGRLGGSKGTLYNYFRNKDELFEAFVQRRCFWHEAAIFGELPAAIGWLGVAGLAGGGLLYTVGAVVYATGRPNPWPKVFGYHEVFHALVLAAAAMHYAVIAFVVLPHARG